MNTAISSIIIPNSVTRIGEGFFGHCLNLETVTIGSSVKWLGYYNFIGEKNLKKIYCKPTTPPGFRQCIITLYDDVLHETPIYVPIGSRDAYMSAPIWKDCKTIIEMSF